MAAFDITRPARSNADSAGRIGGMFVSLFGAVSAWNDARMTRKSLGQLTDHELEDIGLTRGEIDVVSYR